MEAENLFYQCCERINDKLEIAEERLVGCIMFVRRDRGEKSERIWIENDFKYCNYTPYLRELRFISTMRKDALIALAASSMDYSAPLDMLRLALELIEQVDICLMHQSTHANKLQEISDIAYKIRKVMRPTRKIKTDCSLFEEGA